jgi:hypothetical protein
MAVRPWDPCDSHRLQVDDEPFRRRIDWRMGVRRGHRYFILPYFYDQVLRDLPETTSPGAVATMAYKLAGANP